MDNGHYARKAEELQEKLDECLDIAGEIVTARGQLTDAGKHTVSEAAYNAIVQAEDKATQVHHDEATRV